MAGGYRHFPDGTDGVAGVVKGLQSQVNAIRSGAGIRSSILRAAELIFQNEAGVTIGRFGTFVLSLFVDGESAGSETYRGSVFIDPTTQLPLFIAASSSGGLPRVQAGSSGDWEALDIFRVFANDAAINANDVDINSNNDLTLRSGASGFISLTSPAFDVRIAHTTTGSAANAFLDSGTGKISRSTSARKYKTDITTADVDPAEVLQLVGRTWVDKGKLERDEPGPINRHIGFIAEEVDQYSSLRQFVIYDENGDPDALEYDRLTVALLAVVKQQQTDIGALKAQVAAMDKRLTAVEKKSK